MFQVRLKVQLVLVDGAHCRVQIIVLPKQIPFVVPTKLSTKTIVIGGNALVVQVCNYY